MTYTKHIKITDFQKGTMTENIISQEAAPSLAFDPFAPIVESVQKRHGVLAGKQGMSILESAIQSPDGANMLRDAVRFIAFSTYNEMDAGIDAVCSFETSNRPQEEYLRDAAIGVAPKYKSGDATEYARYGFEGGVTITNEQYRLGVKVAMDDVRYDRIGKITQIAQSLGRAMRMTEAKAVYDVLTTTGNYVRSSTAKDNDYGANTQTLTFNAANFAIAKRIVGTAKDRKSGAYLGFNADTLIVGPAMEVYAKQLLMSDEIRRVGGNTTNEIIGTGTTNPLFGMVNNIVVSPWFDDSYGWALFDSRMKPVKFQRVQGVQIMQDAQNASSETFMEEDSIRYVAYQIFGVGMVDDRCVFYSNSTTVPTVA